MQYLVYTHIWTYTIELDYLVQMLDKVWVICVQFSHLCMCDKVNFSLYIIPCVKGFRRVSVDCLFYTFRQGGYLHTYIYMTVAPVDTYMYVDMLCVRVCVCIFIFLFFDWLVTWVNLFLSFIFKWSCLCSTKDCNSFPEQGSCSGFFFCIDLSSIL